MVDQPQNPEEQNAAYAAQEKIVNRIAKDHAEVAESLFAQQTAQRKNIQGSYRYLGAQEDIKRALAAQIDLLNEKANKLDQMGEHEAAGGARKGAAGAEAQLAGMGGRSQEGGGMLLTGLQRTGQALQGGMKGLVGSLGTLGPYALALGVIFGELGRTAKGLSDSYEKTASAAFNVNMSSGQLGQANALTAFELESLVDQYRLLYHDADQTRQAFAGLSSEIPRYASKLDEGSQAAESLLVMHQYLGQTGKELGKRYMSLGRIFHSDVQAQRLLIDVTKKSIEITDRGIGSKEEYYNQLDKATSGVEETGKGFINVTGFLDKMSDQKSSVLHGLGKFTSGLTSSIAGLDTGMQMYLGGMAGGGGSGFAGIMKSINDPMAVAGEQFKMVSKMMGGLPAGAQATQEELGKLVFVADSFGLNLKTSEGNLRALLDAYKVHKENLFKNTDLLKKTTEGGESLQESTNNLAAAQDKARTSMTEAGDKAKIFGNQLLTVLDQIGANKARKVALEG